MLLADSQTFATFGLEFAHSDVTKMVISKKTTKFLYLGTSDAKLMSSRYQKFVAISLVYCL